MPEQSKIFKIETDESVRDIERSLLRHGHIPIVYGNDVLLATRVNNDPLIDSWRALAIATLYRNQPDTSVRLWGLKDKADVDIKEIAVSLPGLAALYLSASVTLDGPERQSVNPKPVVLWIANACLGMPLSEALADRNTDSDDKNAQPRPVRSDRRILVEFSDLRSRILRKAAGPGKPIDVHAFRSVVFDMFSDIGVEFKRRPGRAAGEVSFAALDGLTLFMREIFENAFRHGHCEDSLDGSATRQLRFMQVRKYKDLAGSPVTLAERAGRTSEVLGNYITNVQVNLAEHEDNPLYEVVISDFGLGIVDHYLARTRTAKREEPRKELLSRLLSDQLSSNKMDPSAGLGLSKALEAARACHAFVSVRTNEFWYGQSFEKGDEDLTLRSLTGDPLSKIAGTHWHFVWGPQQ